MRGAQTKVESLSHALHSASLLAGTFAHAIRQLNPNISLCKYAHGKYVNGKMIFYTSIHMCCGYTMYV